MNILFLTLSNMEDINRRGIYTDLVRELRDNQVNMFVVSPREKRTNLGTELIIQDDINLLRVRTGNITATQSFIEKGISSLKIERQYLSAIKKMFPDTIFDMIIYSTPPITFNKVIKYFKKKDNSKTYLMLKDIFPQNAVDINVMKKEGALYKIFRKKEIDLYKISDTIGCMSQGNIDYVLKNNSFINENKMELFPNSISPIEIDPDRYQNKEIRHKYNIPSDKILFVYGGNLGKPQGADFIIEVIDNFHKVNNGYLLIIGDGTEFDKINNFVSSSPYANVKVLNKLPKDDYDKVVESADVGLIFLDYRFTIPNIPSRLLSYMEYSIPILAATDSNTDLKSLLYTSNSGLWCKSDNVHEFIKVATRLTQKNDERTSMGKNGREYLENKFDVRFSVRKILDKNDKY